LFPAKELTTADVEEEGDVEAPRVWISAMDMLGAIEAMKRERVWPAPSGIEAAVELYREFRDWARATFGMSLWAECLLPVFNVAGDGKFFEWARTELERHLPSNLGPRSAVSEGIDRFADDLSDGD
jgi:hypothetical protein